MPFSVIVPARNEERFLTDLLDSLMPQLDFNDEVIVVDDYSTDRTVEIAEKYGCRVVTAREDVRMDRNIGVLAARNPIIVTTDADCIIPDGHFDKVRAHFQDPSLVGLCGPIHSIKQTLIGNFIALVASRTWEGLGANTAYTKAAYEEVGGYPKLPPHRGMDVAFWKQLKGVGLTKYDRSIPVLTDMETVKAQTIPLVAVSSVSGITGLVLRRKGGKAKLIGDLAVGFGVGLGGSELAWELSDHRSLGIIKCEDGECVVEKHIHHNVIGMILLIVGGVVSALPVMEKEAREELGMGIVGTRYGMITHSILTT